MSASQGERRAALVVGNGSYKHTSWLANPPNDAQKVGVALGRLGFEVLDGTNLDFASLAGRVRDFGRALREAHVALFFYAGHGLQVKGENYVVPVDAALEHEADIQLELIAVQTILALMEVGNRTSIVILDACRDNPLARNLARSLGASTRSANVGSGLASMERADIGIGTYIAFATAPNKLALDGEGALNSPFTTALLKHIETPGLAITDIMMRVRRDVIAATEKLRQGPQVPWDNSSLVAPFYFGPPQAAQTRKAPPPDPSVITDRAERDWERFEIATTEHIPIIEAYVAQYATSEPLWAVRAGHRLEVVQALIAGREEKARMEVEARQFAPITIQVGPKGAKGQRTIQPGSGEGFKDFEHGPEMVIVPKGEYLMGSPENEEGRSSHEGPQHRVMIPAPFAIGRDAVTRGEFTAFVNDTGYRTEGGVYVWTGSELKLDPSKSWRDPGFTQDISHPVVCVRWEDARAYIAWLNSSLAMELYRLPTEAEWEYAARAGTTSPFWWGSLISTKQANYDGNYDCRGGEYRQQTVPVKSFDPNPWGLYQVHGNVWEWNEDQWHDSYADKLQNLKSNGGPWTVGGSGDRVVRGGSWNMSPWLVRSAVRDNGPPVTRVGFVGFRVARTLLPL